MTISPRIFLCHAHEDREKVGEIHRRLSTMGLNPWKDSEDLPPGSEWQRLISETLKASDFVLVCCTRFAVQKAGYFQLEIREAIELSKEKSPAQIYLIPAKLEECEPHALLKGFHYLDLFDEHGWDRLSDSIELEMNRRGLNVTRDESGRMVFEDPKSGQAQSSDEKTRLLSKAPIAGGKPDFETPVGEESTTKSFTTKPLVKPTKVRLQDVFNSLETLYGNPNLSETSPLHDFLEEIDSLVEAVALIESQPSEDTVFCIRYISELLKNPVQKIAEQLKKFIADKNCTFNFQKLNPAEFTSMLLSVNMKGLEDGDYYRTVSDLASWRDNQLGEFRSQSELAVKKGAHIRRVFNKFLPGPEIDRLSVGDKRRILELHLADSENWNSGRYKGTYEVRVFDRSNFRSLKDKDRGILKSNQHDVKDTHFGIFSSGIEGQTLVEYRVDEIDLSKMHLRKDEESIRERLKIFSDVWEVSTPLKDVITGTRKINTSGKRPDEKT
jgi:hypothetical protein